MIGSKEFRGVNMKEINVDVVPVLPLQAVLNGECVAIGTVNGGIIVHYIERDKALIVEWDDIVKVGLKDLLSGITTALEIKDLKPTEPVVIKEPTKEH